MSCRSLGLRGSARGQTAPQDHSGAPGYWHRKRDDVVIWNRGLSPSEIAAIYSAGLKGKGALEADLATVVPQWAVSLQGSSEILSWPADADGFILIAPTVFRRRDEPGHRNAKPYRNDNPRGESPVLPLT